MSADEADVIVSQAGVPSRYIDEATTTLNRFAATFEDVQQSRIRATNRGDLYSAAALKKLEDSLSRHLQKALKSHILWPFLEPLKGLAGARTARVIAAIGDPRRFPGQPCTKGHHMPPGLFPEGSPCPVKKVPEAETAVEIEEPVGSGEEVPTAEGTPEIEDGPGGGEVLDGAESRFEIDERDGSVEVSPDSTDFRGEIDEQGGRCPGIMLPPRPHTGVRSLRHYFGLHVVDGHAPRRRKGVQADWNPKATTLILGPNGIADQIVKHRTPGYRDLYDRKKAAQLGRVERPIQAEKAARRYAVQEFLGDLLVEWKRLAGGAENGSEIEAILGPVGEVAA